MDRALEILLTIKENPLLVYAIIGAISFLESFVVIGEFVPGAAFALAGGFLASKGIISITYLIIWAIIGAIAADIISYYLGILAYVKTLNRPMPKRFKEVLTKGERFFRKHGGISVFLGRFIGPLRPIIPFVAGFMRMKTASFLIWATTSGIIWGIAYVGAGYIVGNNIKRILNTLNGINTTIGLILMILVLIYTLRRLRK
ncbi:DedA family protein [Hippea sp. KM1]|uniref:DedA family protein n=1 Tax=Hippea sp. KM1 TaxID=944481 RepID=UPI00046D88D1|nr:DedA family protein [Hippea sp. KM1]